MENTKEQKNEIFLIVPTQTIDHTRGNPSNDHTCCIVWSSITPVIRWAQNSTAFPPIMFLNKKHRHHCDTDLSKKNGDVGRFDFWPHLFSKGAKGPSRMPFLSCKVLVWTERVQQTKTRKAFIADIYTILQYIYIYNAYIMHIPPTKWDVSKFLGPKKKVAQNVFVCLRNFCACPTWMVDPLKLWSSTKIEVDFFITRGQTPTTQTRQPRDVRFIFSMRSNFLGHHLEGQMKSWNSSQLVWNSLVFESPLPRIPGLL